MTTLAGCSNGPSLDGPFGQSGGGSGLLCAWTPTGGVLTDGVLEFPNTGGTAKVQKLTLAGTRHLRLLAAWLVPITGHDLMGEHVGLPTGRGAPPLIFGVDWAQRQRADGATIPHTTGTNVINIVLVLKPSGHIASASGLNIYYTSGGSRYVLQLPIGVKIENPDHCGQAATK